MVWLELQLVMTQMDIDLKAYLDERFNTLQDTLRRLENGLQKASDVSGDNSKRLDRHEVRLGRVEGILMPRIKNNGSEDRFDELQSALGKRINEVSKRLFIYLSVAVVVAVALKEHWTEISHSLISLIGG